MFVVWPTMSCFADWSKRYHATFIIIECRMLRGRRFDIANVEPSCDHWPGQVLEFNVALVWHFQPRVHYIWILHSLLCIICIMWFRCCLQTWCHCYFVSALSMFCLLLALSNYACLRFFTVFSQNTKTFQLEFWILAVYMHNILTLIANQCCRADWWHFVLTIRCICGRSTLSRLVQLCLRKSSHLQWKTGLHGCPCFALQWL